MNYLENYQKWLNNEELSSSEKEELIGLSANENELRERFAAELEFGTAGMRGVLGLGTNRLNRFMVKRATLGLAKYIKSEGGDKAKRGVVISYDTRRCSFEFALLCAKVLSAEGIKSFLFDGVRPVPMCSFAVRHLNAFAGIMITASHNPKQYNGYKVYGEDGAQMSPEATAVVVEYIEKSEVFGIKEAEVTADAKTVEGKDNFKLDQNITVIGKSVDDKYFEQIEKLSLAKDAVDKVGKNIKIVYTPIHGAGYLPVTTILGRMGIKVNVVEKQALPDTEFSTVRVPNPEESDALKLGLELAEKIGSDVVIGTDPDCDRMGVAIKNDKGQFVLLNGNQTGVLLMDYILSVKAKNGVLPKNGAVVKTIVTTTMANKVAESYGVACFDVLTGFKFIGEKIKEWEKSGEFTYLFGFEESFGYLAGTHARDKDAVVASMLFAEMVCYYMANGESVYSRFQQLSKQFGYFTEKGVSITFGGLDGMTKMKAIMQGVRDAKLTSLCGVKVAYVSDFLKRVTTYADGDTLPITLPKTNAVKFVLENGDWLCARPSGTEPKLKLYIACSATNKEAADANNQKYLEEAKKIFNLG